tara:strand:- start:604 stop:831 length:228 start_codon:yes stop_codon:yes gene_type:complete
MKPELKFCRCGQEVHPVRIEYGYSTCVDCSKTKRLACTPITHHKTGNTIQIVSQELAEVLAKSSRRKGYGTCLKR